MANFQITGILEKMTGKDKDYRYMATSDLLNELNKEGFQADTELELKLSGIVLQQLDDAAGDVSGLAVKCLAPLVKKISEARVVEMIERLCDKLLNGKDQHRDIARMSTERKCECLDILCDVLHKFGNLMANDHENLLCALLSLLNSHQASVRKKSVACIASLASSLSDDLLAKAKVEVIHHLRKRGMKSDMIRTSK